MTNRRSFLKSATVGAAPLILSSRAFSADDKPSDKITLGFIGCGKQSQHLISSFLGSKRTKVLAVCDVDTNRREAAKKRVEDRYAQDKPDGWTGCSTHNDFREILARQDIDAVVIATPDHWHAIITIAALKAGKDVYCEKPLTWNIGEALAVMEEVDRNKRVLQTGSMQRSMSEFRVACELVRNGHIGKIKRVECSFGAPAKPCDLPEEAMEPGLDWTLWQGPVAHRPYNSVLAPRGLHDHFPLWREYREYGGGYITDWGAHHLDIAQWGLGMDESGPVEVIPPSDWQTAKNGAVLVYANGVTVKHGGGIGVHFFGEDGEVEVTRGQFSFKQKDQVIARFLRREDGGSLEGALAKVNKEHLGAEPKVKLYRSRDHLDDFLSCVKSRQKPITHEGVGGHSAICCHLMNCAYYNGQKFSWDPGKNALANGTGDSKWLTREYQNGWKLS